MATNAHNTHAIVGVDLHGDEPAPDPRGGLLEKRVFADKVPFLGGLVLEEEIQPGLQGARVLVHVGAPHPIRLWIR
jgi:hypothetical protein